MGELPNVFQKRCRDCNHRKPLDEFPRNRSMPDGHGIYCKTCYSMRSKASYRRRRAARGLSVRERREVPEGYKWCPDCGQTKPVDAFPQNRGRLQSYCKLCHNIRCRDSLAKVGGARHYHLRRRYGIGIDEVAALLEMQGGVCAICGRPDPEHVDHDHATGKVRGILCFNCNGGLGQFRDDAAVLRNAIKYLRESAWQKDLISPGVYALRPPRLVDRARAE